MMLSSLSNLALSTLERSASLLTVTPLKFVPSSNTSPASTQRQAANALTNIKQIFQNHFSAQCQQVLQHQDTAQHPLTVLMPIQPEKQASLRKYLKDSTDSINQFFSKSTSTHFARFVVLHDESQDICQPYLLFSSTHDGSFETYMDELVGLTSAETSQPDVLNAIFEHCESYTSLLSYDTKLFSKFIQTHAVKSDAFFMAYWNKTVPEIKASQSLCHKLNQSLEDPLFCKALIQQCDRLGSLSLTETQKPHASILEVLMQKIEGLLEKQGLKTRSAQYFINSQKPTSAKKNFLMNIVEGLLERHWVKIRSTQKNDPGYHLQSNPTQLARRHESKVIEDQRQMAQNQFLTLHAIQPGFFNINILILKIILWLAAGRAKKAKGNLLGIPTIHSLRWLIVPAGIMSNKPYLLFESNYNGSWDSYVDDFVQYACLRMNLIWGKCQDYQSQGAKDVEWFKQHIRNYLFPAQSYYSAYPDLTVRNILTFLRVAEIVKTSQQSFKTTETDQAYRALISLKLLLAGAYHSIN
jgi:hypothetical protein